MSSARKEGFPGKFPGFQGQFPAALNPIIASLAASRPTPRWLLESEKPSKNPRRSPLQRGTAWPRPMPLDVANDEGNRFSTRKSAEKPLFSRQKEGAC